MTQAKESLFPPLNLSNVQESSRTWATLWGESKEGRTLKFSPPIEGSPVVITIDDVEAGLRKWQYAVLGCIVGYNLPYQVVKKFIETKWRDLGRIDVMSLKHGVFVFNFKTSEYKQRVLDQASWILGSKLLFLKP